ncbi:ADP-ribosylglycohydrolase family protein [Paenibacillus xanthanilyticus]|uniref:ADP-ribosylglycohydrolase family protein n=1 Tax=Paenibacillus xanthanilyticus TaxID=1783531 RepID=UPI003629B546
MSKVRDGILGLCVGDAPPHGLGATRRVQIPTGTGGIALTDMIGYGSNNQPAGKWSDDSSLTFALMQEPGRCGRRRFVRTLRTILPAVV